MISGKSFLSFDFGAGSLKVAEFDLGESRNLVLKEYGIRPLGLEGSQDSAREALVRKAIQELFAQKGFRARRANVCAPGYHVFSKFVKLPPVDSVKVTQIIQYEAQQNVPFPLEEVVWDYQILGTTASGEMEVLLVAIKGDIVEGLFRTAEATGMKLQIVDVSPAALCNAFRYNYSDFEGCAMLLDVGAKTSNLLFFEKGKVYSRGINIGANSITQEFAAEAKLRFAEAEKIKIAEGFVGLGGAYEEPDNAHQAAISKIARQVMTRLHIQVNQTIQFYRGQQGGSAPQQLFLAGGASIMPYTAQFFAEKLSIPVEYFNPFRNIQIDPSVNVEELAKVAHGFGEVVGAGLRNVAECPVELNLVPKTILKRQQLDEKKPFFIAAIFCLVLVVWSYGWFKSRVASVRSEELEKVKLVVGPLKAKADELGKHQSAIRGTKDEIDFVSGLLAQRHYWPDLLSDLTKTLAAIEKQGAGGKELGIWIESFGTEQSPRLLVPAATGPAAAPVEAAPAENSGFTQAELAGTPGAQPDSLSLTTSPSAASAQAKISDTTNSIPVTFLAVDLGSQSENNKLPYRVAEEFQKSPYLVKDGTKLSLGIGPADDITVRFGMTLKLKFPIIR